jgi:hypothetical protein
VKGKPTKAGPTALWTSQVRNGNTIGSIQQVHTTA